MIAKLDFQMVQNEAYTEDFTFLDGDDQPIDLNVYEDIKMDIRYSNDAASPLLAKARLGSGFAIKGAGNNILSLTIPADLLRQANNKQYYYDWLFVEQGQHAYYIKGTVTITKTNTR